MNIPISKARAQWHELVRRAEAGEEIVLTRYGRPFIALKPEKSKQATPGGV